MARGKKTEKPLTLEEKLAEALVPMEEQPYPVPGNWCWVPLEYVAQIVMGQSPVGDATTDDSSYMPLIGGAADMGVLHPKATRYTKTPTKTSTTQDIIICIRATLGHPIFSDGKYCLGRGVAAIRPHFGTKEYFRYFFLNFEQYLYDNATGTTFAQVSSQTLQQMPFPLPPLIEQQRITSRIDSLFAKLDEVKEKAQAVVDSFETRKAAILHKAFTGELTKKWRIVQCIDSKKWPLQKLSEICDVRDGTHDSPQYHSTGYPLVTSKNLKNGIITYKDAKLISSSDYEQINLRSKVDVGDVLFAIIGTIGNPVVITEKPNFAIKNVALFKNINKINPFFLKYYFESEYVKNKMKKDAKGTTQKFVPLLYLRSFLVPVPSEAEQVEIVRILDKLLAKEQHVKKIADAVLDQIDTMKKSILARAFRGELGTNDPMEEWAGNLVREALKSEMPKQSRAKAVFIPKELEMQLESELERKIIKLYLKNESETLAIGVLMAVSSKKFEVMDALRNLEQRGIIKKNNNGNYSLMR